jgi:hypothetical protein
MLARDTTHSLVVYFAALGILDESHYANRQSILVTEKE